jgi:hypothetical protein
MRRLSLYYVLLSASALASTSACGGAGSPVALPAEHSTSAQVTQGNSHRYDGLVFVSDEQDNAVWVCPAELGDIRHGYYSSTVQLSGVSDPAQMAVDAQGNLYVANAQIDATGAGEIAEYPRGATSPTRMLKSGLNTSTGVAVDTHGTVYASNKYWGSIVVFPSGKSVPSETIKKNLQGPDGLALDKSGDLFIADSSANDVLELQHGSKTPQSLHLTGLARPTGVALDKHGNLYVSNYLGAASNVTVYPHGSTSPSQTIVVPGPPYGSESTIAETFMVSIAQPGDVLMASAPISLALIGGQEWFGYYSIVVGYIAGQTQPAWSVESVTGGDSVFQPAK